MSRLEHGTPEGFDRGCTKSRECPAFAVHGMSCETAHIRFVTGERRYLQLRGRGLTSTQIAQRLGFSPEKAVAEAIEQAEDERRHAVLSAAKKAANARRREEKGVEMATPKDVAGAKKVTPAPKPVKAVKPVAPKKPRVYVPPSVVPVGGASTAEVRAWARENSLMVPDRGRLPYEVVEAFNAAQSNTAAGLLREMREGEGRTIHEVDEAELRARVASPSLFAHADDLVEAELAALNAEADGEPDVPEGLMSQQEARKLALRPMEPAVLVPALSEPAEHELAGIQEALVHRDGIQTPSGRWPAYGPSYAGLLTQLDEMTRYAQRMREERDQARVALDLAVRKWWAERLMRRALGKSATLARVAPVPAQRSAWWRRGVA